MDGKDFQHIDAARAACRQFHGELSAYLEGEEKPAVLAHARECLSCAVILADLEQIRFVSHHLPLEEPPARVWANVRVVLAEEGLLHERLPAWHRWIPRLPFMGESVPIGALAGLAVLGLMLLTSWWNFENQGPTPALAGNQQVVTAGMLSPEFDSNLREMEQAYVAYESSLDPTIKATYRRSLDCLDADIQECLSHCRREPNDVLARQYLARAYESKADVLASALMLSSR